MKKTTESAPKITAQKLGEMITWHLKYSLCKQVCEAHKEHLFTALALSVRDLCVNGMFDTASRHTAAHPKRIYYLSMEYLMGRMLSNNMYNLGIMDLLDKVKLANPIPLRDVLDCEEDPALGNGGLGRLAACILDSVATQGYAGYGYGINYQYGLFKQYFDHGWQKERADSWLDKSSPWEIERADRACLVPIMGRLAVGDDGVHHWVDAGHLIGLPYDMPIVGYEGKTVNYLRLFAAKSTNTLDIEVFNRGGYVEAIQRNIETETISRVLYPSDDNEHGKELRLVQQYFFVACVVNDIVRRFLETQQDFTQLPKHAVIQLNDTHPTLAIAELMRILMDVFKVPFDQAFDITRQTMAYTNHTLLPEALEKWSVNILEKYIPRHLDIIYQINDKLMHYIGEKYPGDVDMMRRMSIIEESEPKFVRMANLAMTGSFSVNGVAQIHTDLLKKNVAADFYQLWPEKFNNQTNGVTPRRWLLASNDALSRFITHHIGTGWITNLSELKKLEALQDDEKALKQLGDIKRQNKERLATLIDHTTGVAVNLDSIFDCQVKRIHEYKRQFLNICHVMHQYFSIVEDHQDLIYPKTYIFGGKAAPSYMIAKLIIKLINSVADVVNNDARVGNQLRVAFIPDYKVSIAEVVFPGADISEQISTAGFEASGTGNMKFTMNGALTIGTLDGANIEIRNEVGAENFYDFGLTSEEVAKLHQEGSYKPWDYYNNDSRIKRVIDALQGDLFTGGDGKGLYEPLFQAIMSKDYFMNLADFGSYTAVQDKISSDYINQHQWNKKVLLNIARSGIFSIDRTVQGYAKDIWHVQSTLNVKENKNVCKKTSQK